MTNGKRRIFLEQLEKSYETKAYKFDKFLGPGLKRKIQRLIFSHRIYIPYLLTKMGLNKKEKTGKLFWGRKIILNTDDLDASLLIHSGLLYSKSEYSLTKFFIKYLKENDIFYDIGANCGFYSHLAIEFCQEVHAFEPLSDVFTYLYKNLSKENNIFLNNLALSDNSASDFLYIRKNQSGVSTLIPDNPKSEIYIKTKVETDTLDRYSIKHKKPTIIKLDVEGAENLVLEGGIDTIKKYKPTRAMEVRGG